MSPKECAFPFPEALWGPQPASPAIVLEAVQYVRAQLL